MATIVQRVGSRKSILSGLSVGLGAMTADGIFLLLTYLGWTRLISEDKGAIGWVYLLGGSVMIIFASAMIIRSIRIPKSADHKISRAKSSLEQVRRRENGFAYFLGLSMGLSNPFQIAWWLSVGLASISTFGPIVALGFFLGILAWLLIFTISLKAGSSKITNFETYTLYASSLVLYGFGIWFLYSALQSL